MFARHGVPTQVHTDNCPPFNGDLFTKWGTSIGFTHRRVTPLWPQANGEVEQMMNTLGKIDNNQSPGKEDKNIKQQP
jgi:hypothetical protein